MVDELWRGVGNRRAKTAWVLMYLLQSRNGLAGHNARQERGHHRRIHPVMQQYLHPVRQALRANLRSRFSGSTAIDPKRTMGASVNGQS